MAKKLKATEESKSSKKPAKNANSIKGDLDALFRNKKSKQIKKKAKEEAAPS